MLLNAFITVLVLFFFAGGAMFCFDRFGASLAPGYRALSKTAMDRLSALTARFPLALWEFLLLLLAVLFLIGLVCVIAKKKGFLKWLAWLFILIAVLVFLFVALWGLNHYAPPISEMLELEVGEYTEEELIEATRYYMAMAELYAGQVERTGGGELAAQDFDELAVLAGKSYAELGENYSIFRCSDAPVKKALLTRLAFDYGGTTGLFVCFTGESTVNPNTYVASLAHTMCHEVAHRCCIAGEDEANFAAFLACSMSDDARFLYSGYYSAFLYCYNALAEANPSAASALWSTDYALLRLDCHAANVHYEQYDGKVQEAVNKVNDTYLKAFSEESGIRSYGEAADYLIAWYQTRIRE